jgi:hypothetical protein
MNKKEEEEEEKEKETEEKEEEKEEGKGWKIKEKDNEKLYNKQKRLCKGLSLKDCEMSIIRMQTETALDKISARITNKPEIQGMIHIVEDFLQKGDFIVYGGTAINNILPKELQFYDYTQNLADYDFFSSDALQQTKRVVDLFYDKGYKNVEGKAGVHHNTYKVFVENIPMADITYLDPILFKKMFKESIEVNNIHYASPQFLRMSVYLELSRPAGYVERWEKIVKRMNLLDKVYPLNFECFPQLNNKETQNETFTKWKKEKEKKKKHLYQQLKYLFVEQNVVFMGGIAVAEYLKKLGASSRKNYFSDSDKNIPYEESLPMYVLDNQPYNTIRLIESKINTHINKHITHYDGGKPHSKNSVTHSSLFIEYKESFGGLIPEHWNIFFHSGKHKELLAIIFKTESCYSYHLISSSSKKTKREKKNEIKEEIKEEEDEIINISLPRKAIKIASIETIMTFYFAFLYVEDEKEFDSKRIACFVQQLYNFIKTKSSIQKGILKRYTTDCYGHQNDLRDQRAIKQEKYKELTEKNQLKSKEFEEWFLNYVPKENKKESTTKGKSSFLKTKRKKKINPTSKYNSYVIRKTRRRIS